MNITYIILASLFGGFTIGWLSMWAYMYFVGMLRSQKEYTKAKQDGRKSME